MKTKIVLALSAMALSCISLSTAAKASDPKLLGTFGDWSAYAYTDSGNKVCYMASTPIKAEGKYTKRGDIIAFITHRPAEGTKNEFSYMTGYPYKDSGNATVAINNSKFTLFTQGESAWTTDASTDKKLIESIRKGSRMIVKGQSKRGTLTTDTFSLKGSAAAHEAINKECF